MTRIPDQIPDRLPFEVVLRTKQIEFEQRLQQLSELEKQQLTIKLFCQVLHLEEAVRYWELICEQKQASIELMAKMAAKDLSRPYQQPITFIDLGGHDE